MEEDECDIEALTAFLEADSDSEDDVVQDDSEKGLQIQTDDELLSLATDNIEISNDECLLSTENTVATVAISSVTTQPAQIYESVPANKTPTAPVISPTHSGVKSPQELQAELALMQKRMMEIQQQLISQNTAPPAAAEATSKYQELDENPFFSDPVIHSREKALKKQTNKVTINKAALSERKNLKDDLFGSDNDSDWEDMDGDKVALSEPGQDLQNLLKRDQKQRQAHTPKYSPPAKHQGKITDAFYGKETHSTSSLSSTQSPVSVKRPEPSSSYRSRSDPDDAGSITDAFSGIRIINPLVPMSVLQLKMEGRRMIAVSRLESKNKSADLQGDWVTIGVLVHKTEPRKSATGKTFCIWRISDLDDCDKPVAFFLFGEVYKHHWKSDVGTVIGLLNPNIMDSADRQQSDLAITIKHPNQVLILGRSRDLGKCQSRTKAGNPCSNFINKRQGEYCTYHIQVAYKKTCSKRTDLQSGYTGITPKAFEKKFMPKGSHFIYGGQSFSTLSHHGSKKKNQMTLKKLQQQQAKCGGKVTTMTIHELEPADKAKLKEISQQKEENFMELLSAPSPGAMHFVKHLLKKECKKKVDTGSVIQSISATDLIKQHKKEIIDRKKKQKSQANFSQTNNGFYPPPTGDPLKATPTLGRGLQAGQQFVLDFDQPPLNKAISTGADRQKVKAIAKIQAAGGIKQDDPNAVRKLKSPEAAKKVKKRVAECMKDPVDLESTGPANKRSKLLGNLDLNSPEVQKLIKARSSHSGAVAEIEAERQEKYFNELEKKEMIEQKMDSITEVKCSAFSCKQCRYTAFTPAQRCRDEHHNIVKHKATKRFFKCKNCKKRKVTLQKYPKDPCSNCGEHKFDRTSMLMERKGPQLESEKLSVRGDEIKYLNSLKN